MSYKNFKTNSNCVGCNSHSSTISFEGDITKTSQALRFGECVQKSMTDSDNTIRDEGLVNTLENFSSISAKAGKS